MQSASRLNVNGISHLRRPARSGGRRTRKAPERPPPAPPAALLLPLKQSIMKTLSWPMRINTHADPMTEKRKAYDAATVLLAKQDDCSLRYAALEVRRCLEAVVYEKLRVYDVLLPEDSVYKWQPPQAFDALIEIEPNAEESCTISIAMHKEPGSTEETHFQRLGVDERPKGKWIKKTWQKLGSYLHADWPFSSGKPRSPLQPFLEKTLKELAPLVNNSFTMTMSNNIDFDCSGCGKIVRVMEKAVESSRRAACLNCGMRYRAEKPEETFLFYPDEPPFACECGAVFFIPSRHIEVGYKFACGGCKRAFQINGFDWKFNAVIDDAVTSESESDSEET